MSESELRRQATAAGVFLDLNVPLSSAGGGAVPVAPDAAEAEALLVWLDAWQSEPREQRELAWFELVDGGSVRYRVVSVARWAAADILTAINLDTGETERTHSLSSGTFDQYEVGQEFSVDPAPEKPRKWQWVPGAGRQLPIVRPLLDPPAGFELIRRSWCPRCDRAAGDPLGHPVERRFGDRAYAPGFRFIKPPAPLVEIGPGCPGDGFWTIYGFDTATCPGCGHGTRRLYRWGLRRQQKPALMWPQELFRD